MEQLLKQRQAEIRGLLEDEGIDVGVERGQAGELDLSALLELADIAFIWARRADQSP